MADQSPPVLAPVGSGDYVVQQGDCISSIAYKHGLLWETLWNHPSNQELQRVRKNPSLLLPGDRVCIPDTTLRTESGTTEKKHAFRVKSAPVKLRLRILTPPARSAQADAPDEPWAAVGYELNIEGKTTKGITDSAGLIEVDIPPNACTGVLTLARGKPAEWRTTLKLGHLDPVQCVTGVQARLNNLGFHCGPVDGVVGPKTSRALARFQASAGLEPTGNIDEATTNALGRAHDVPA